MNNERALLIERLCRVQHDAYEAAATREGWQTQESSRKPWDDVPAANKATMRASMAAVLDALHDDTQEEVSARPDIDFDTNEIVERIINEVVDDQIVLDGRVWAVEQTDDPFEFEILELLDDYADGRCLRVRLGVTEVRPA